MSRALSSTLVLGFFVIFAAGCSDDGNMMPGGGDLGAGGSSVRLATADVRVGGRSVNEATIPSGSGSSTLFTVSLADPADRGNVREIRMEYVSHSPMAGMGDSRSVECHDDGTHGDAVAGDCIYSYLDVDGHIGPHYQDCASGSHVYTFHGTDMTGQHTNAVECRVTVR